MSDNNGTFHVSAIEWNRVVTDPAFVQPIGSLVTIKVDPATVDLYCNGFRSDGSHICQLTHAESNALHKVSASRFAASVVLAVDAIETMFDAFKAQHNQPIGDDGFGDEYAADLLKAMHALLNFEVRGIDCSDMSKRIHAIAAAHKLIDRNGEISA